LGLGACRQPARLADNATTSRAKRERPNTYPLSLDRRR
jgi:hypothetical protein